MACVIQMATSHVDQRARVIHGGCHNIIRNAKEFGGRCICLNPTTRDEGTDALLLGGILIGFSRNYYCPSTELIQIPLHRQC